MEYALVLWTEGQTTSVVEKSCLLTCQEIGEKTLVKWDEGTGPPKAYEATIIDISKDMSELDKKANNVVIEPTTKHIANRKNKRRLQITDENENAQISNMIKKGRTMIDNARRNASLNVSRAILSEIQAPKSPEHSGSMRQTSMSETLDIIRQNDNNFEAGEVVLLQQKFEAANRTIAKLEEEVRGLKAHNDSLASQVYEMELASGSKGTNEPPPAGRAPPASPAKIQFLRNLADFLSDNPQNIAKTTNNIGGADMIELEPGHQVFIKRIDRMTILLRAKGDPGHMLALTLEKLYDVKALAQMSACGKRGMKDSLDQEVKCALIEFIKSNVSAERFQQFNLVRCLNNKFSGARRQLKITSDTYAKLTEPNQQINSQDSFFQ